MGGVMPMGGPGRGAMREGTSQVFDRQGRCNATPRPEPCLLAISDGKRRRQKVSKASFGGGLRR